MDSPRESDKMMTKTTTTNKNYNNSNKNDNDNDENSHNNSSLSMIGRFKSMPLVAFTSFWLTDYYQRVKQTNSVTQVTCQLAESTVLTACESLYAKLGPNRVEFMDTVACAQLDRLLIAYYGGNEANTNSKIDSTNSTDDSIKNNITNKDNTSSAKKVARNFLSKMLELSESFIESNLIYTELVEQQRALEVLQQQQKQQSEQKTGSLVVNGYLPSPINQNDAMMSGGDASFNYNQELYERYENEKENEESDLSDRTKMLTLVAYNSLQCKLLRQLSESFQLFKSYLLNLFKIIETFSSLKETLSSNLKEKFHVTKDKIDLYKEYLDVLAKQFTVQDGRSLDHVKSFEEQTKIIIRRSIGNLLTAFHMIHARVKHMDLGIQGNFATVRDILVNMYKIYNKKEQEQENNKVKHNNNNNNDNNIKDVESLIDETKDCMLMIESTLHRSVDSLLNESVSKQLEWFVPNFGAFGVLDECDDENEHEEDRKDSNFIEQEENNNNSHTVNKNNHQYRQYNYNNNNNYQQFSSHKSNKINQNSCNSAGFYSLNASFTENMEQIDEMAEREGEKESQANKSMTYLDQSAEEKTKTLRNNTSRKRSSSRLYSSRVTDSLYS